MSDLALRSPLDPVDGMPDGKSAESLCRRESDQLEVGKQRLGRHFGDRLMANGPRGALMSAALEELAASGYAEFSLERVLGSAGAGADRFEAEFDGIDECLSAAYEELGEAILARASAGCEAAAEWPGRVREGLAAVLAVLAAEPQMALVIFRSFPGVRPSFYTRYVELLGRFEPLMREGREFSGLAEELPGEVELLALGAAESIIYGELDAGRTEQLPSLLPEILFSVLVPFLGPERAAEEMRAAAAAS
jgi:hypothetical protein